jgi:hypothetical protein
MSGNSAKPLGRKETGFNDFRKKVRHEAAQEDGGRPLEAALQEEASNHLKLHWLRVSVVSVKEKARQDRVRCRSER